MSIFKRMLNMGKAKVNNALNEMENPVELLDQKISDMEESFNKAKLSAAKILGNEKEIKRNMDIALHSSHEWEEKVKLAMNKGNEDLAKKALTKKLESDKEYDKYKTLYKAAEANSVKVKEQLNNLENEIKKTRQYRDEVTARINNANATCIVNEVLSDVETSSNSITIDSIERKIQMKETFAEGLQELRTSNNLDAEFEDLNSIDLNAELEKYRN